MLSPHKEGRRIRRGVSIEVLETTIINSKRKMILRIIVIVIALVIAPRINWEWVTEKVYKAVKRKKDDENLFV